MSNIKENGNGPFVLSFTKPMNMPCYDGTALATPPLSATSSPVAARPPTPGGGPLSSHPTTPISYGNTWSPPPTWSTRPPTPPSETTYSPTPASHARKDSFRTPLSPASPNMQRRDSTGARKLLSLTSLRNSFSSSRTSLSSYTTPQPSKVTPEQRQPPLKRPSSPSFSSTVSVGQPHPQLRKRKSGGWFRRKSGLFLFETESQVLDAVQESAQSRPETRRTDTGSLSHAPSIPEVGSLRGGRLTGGSISGDDIFATICR